MDQLELNFNRALSEMTRGRRAPKALRHSGESSAHVEYLLKLAEKVPNQIELRSPIQSGIAPARFQQHF